MVIFGVASLSGEQNGLRMVIAWIEELKVIGWPGTLVLLLNTTTVAIITVSASMEPAKQQQYAFVFPTVTARS